jgi:hypothetical protein
MSESWPNVLADMEAIYARCDALRASVDATLESMTRTLYPNSVATEDTAARPPSRKEVARGHTSNTNAKTPVSRKGRDRTPAALPDRDGARRARRVYQCTEQGGCNGWHITTTPEPQVEQELPPEPEWKKMWLRD